MAKVTLTLVGGNVRRSWIGAGVLAFASLLVIPGTVSAAPSTHVLPLVRPVDVPVAAAQTPGTERGAYEWDDSTWWPTPSAYAGTLTELKNLGITTLYVDITEAVSLMRAHSSRLASFESAFGQLVEEANADGFAVDAVGGDPTWATKQKKGPAQLLAAVAQIVAASPGAVLGGVQFDVEPWGLKSWHSRRGKLATAWLRFIQSTVSAWQHDGLTGRLGFTVPYWFDGATGGVPQVTFAGATNYPFQLALGLLAPLDQTMLNVMAYRNVTTGPNGSVALFASNVNAVESAGARTELLAGQETGRSLPAETTFYGTSCATFDAATAQIADAFSGDAPYGGIAVDDVETLEALCPD
jgi:hypothetical protein